MGAWVAPPFVARKIKAFLPKSDLLTYLEAVLRVYNLNGRRDNKYKSRIKILVKAIGLDAFSAQVELVYRNLDSKNLLNQNTDISTVKSRFRTVFPFPLNLGSGKVTAAERETYSRWLDKNTLATKFDNYRSAYISLKTS